MVDVVNVGTAANSGDGDTLRGAFLKTNAKFVEMMALALYNGLLYTNRGAWVTLTVYAVNDLVAQGGVIYCSQVAHTAGTFATDLAAGKWTIHQGVTSFDLVDTSSAAKGAGMVGNATMYCPTRAFAKTVAPAVNPVVFLGESGREGFFVWRAGNYATRVAADTQEGRYLQHASIAATVGAWERIGDWHADHFGIPLDPASGAGGGGEVQCHTQMIAMQAIGAIDKPTAITFGSKIYTLGAHINEWTWQVQLIGQRGAQGTIICKRYVEASAVRGIIAFTDFGSDTIDIAIRATSGSGGSGQSYILTVSDPAAGRTHMVRPYISCGNFVNHSLYVDGAANIDLAGPSYRGFWLTDGELFGALVSTVKLRNVHHFFVNGGFCVTSGGSGATVLDLDATGLLDDGLTHGYCDDVQWSGVLQGNVSIDYLSRSIFTSPQIGTITAGANVTDTRWNGPRVSGGIVNNAASGEFQHDHDGIVIASGGNATSGWRKWGSGKLEQWGTATTVAGVVTAQSWPVTFTSTAIQVAGNCNTDQGANIVNCAQVIPTSITQYDVKAYNFNYSTGSYAGAGVAVRWLANGT